VPRVVGVVADIETTNYVGDARRVKKKKYECGIDGSIHND
jgi:hypothetical protein